MTKEEIESGISQLEDEIGELQDQIEVYNGMLKEIENEEKQKNMKEQEPCDDCISRRAVKELFDEGDVIGVYHFLGIGDLPPVQPKPKTGQWTEDIDNNRLWDRVRFYCSECGDWQTYGKTEFCPCCGARMESEG